MSNAISSKINKTMPKRPDTPRHDPSFFRGPINNDRTGWQPVSLPLILIEPHRRTSSGLSVIDSEAFDIRFFIADAPLPSKVAGPFNTGLLVPNVSLFSREVSRLELSRNQIDLSGQPFKNSNGVDVDFNDAIEGDTFSYTIDGNGANADDIPYFPDANYYDVSVFTIPTIDLPAPERYLFVWEASYFKRIVNADMQFICIDKDDIAITQFIQDMNHPGEVHHEMFRKTPELYFDKAAADISKDELIKFYRPFADILQDIFDESSLIEGVNQVDKIPAQLIPYLAFLIGWDLPNFPGVSDNVRRSILKNGVRLQQLKGTRRAIVEFFEIIGFSIDLLNLWFSKDGTEFISPGDDLPSDQADEEIKIEKTCQIEPLVADFNENGFGELEIPLLYRPNGKITIDAFFVTDDSTTKTALDSTIIKISDDPDFLADPCDTNSSGFFVPTKLLDELPPSDSNVISTSTIFIDENGKAVDEIQTGTEPTINEEGVSYDSDKNIVKVTFDHFLEFASIVNPSGEPKKLYIFATYEYDKIIVPSILSNTRSNRFDVRILLKDDLLPPPQELLEFLLNYIFRLKAFHSILRKIIFTLVATEVYNVTDFCIGGDLDQDPRFDGGKLQIPPAIIPSLDGCNELVDGDCGPEQVQRNFKDGDILLRQAIIKGLKEEHSSWKSLDDTHENSPLHDLFSNLPARTAQGEDCQFTQYGQDRVEIDGEFGTDGCFQPADLDNIDTRAKVCDTTTLPLPDSCFKGRVTAELDVDPIVPLSEISKCVACELQLGDGVYYTYPVITSKDPVDGQQKSKFLGKLLKQYNKPVPRTLHYSNRPSFIDNQPRRDSMLAIQRPSLNISKDNLGFPGHRMPTLNKLEFSFIHPDYRARPWDDEFSLIDCSRNRVEENGLNANLQIDTNDNEFIVYDDADLTYFGNGFVPDISGLGSHDSRTFAVTHSVYMSTTASHSAITLDGRVEITSKTEIEFDSNVSFDPLFDSYNVDCNKDFIDGYPSSTGRFTFDPQDFDFDRDDGTTVPDPLECLLGVPTSGTASGDSLFKLGSQILLDSSDAHFRFYVPYRLDCSCLSFDCSTDATATASEATSLSELNIPQCILDKFSDVNGFFEADCDKIETIPRMILNELIGSCSTRLDGTINSLMCVLEQGSDSQLLIPDNQFVSNSGRIFFQDEYDIIYEIVWEIIGIRMDMLVITKDPRVWGEDPSGFVKNRRVFRKGIITTCRNIIEFDQDNVSDYVLIGTGYEQEVNFFQVNFPCPDEKPVDNFCYHLDCSVIDEVELVINCGPRWADPDEDLDNCVVWSDVANDGSIIQSSFSQVFAFIDVWNEDTEDLTVFCCDATGT